jgi:hypothetical protein
MTLRERIERAVTEDEMDGLYGYESWIEALVRECIAEELDGLISETTVAWGANVVTIDRLRARAAEIKEGR